MGVKVKVRARRGRQGGHRREAAVGRRRRQRRAPAAAAQCHGRGDRGGCQPAFARAVRACKVEAVTEMSPSSPGGALWQRKARPRPRRGISSISTGSTCKTLRRIIDMAHAMKRAGKRVPAKMRPRGIEDALLVTIFEKPSTRTRISFDVAMRQLGGQTICAQQHGSAARSRRIHRRYRARALALRRCHHDPRQRARDPARARRLRHDPGHQRPDRQEPSLPGHGRHHDLRGAQGADQGPHAWPGSATATTSPPRGCTRPCASASSSGSPARTRCAPSSR